MTTPAINDRIINLTKNISDNSTTRFNNSTTDLSNKTISTTTTTTTPSDDNSNITMVPATDLVTRNISVVGVLSLEGNGAKLSLPAIIGLALGSALILILTGSLVGYFVYKHRCGHLRITTTKQAKKKDDGWDDTIALSYINSNFDIVDWQKEISDDVVSLDNDQFLNSLESMMFSNLWMQGTSSTTSPPPPPSTNIPTISATTTTPTAVPPEKT